nr:hypothetical protein [Actinomycetes bacterium]
WVVDHNLWTNYTGVTTRCGGPYAVRPGAVQRSGPVVGVSLRALASSQVSGMIAGRLGVSRAGDYAGTTSR